MTSISPAPDSPEAQTQSKKEPFDRPVLLKPSPLWAQLVAVTIISVTALVIGWATIAKIEEAIPAQGKLEPQGAVQPVQAPVQGVVAEIHVQEGDSVAEGDVLITFDQTTVLAEIESQEAIRASLIDENAFYQAQMDGLSIAAPAATFRFRSLAENRQSLVAENRLFRSQLRGKASLSPAQTARFQASQSEVRSRLERDRLEVAKFQRELSQVNVQIDNAQSQLNADQNILERIQPLAGAGGISEVQLLRQEQQVNERQTQLNSLREEQQRLEIAIAQAKVVTSNTVFGNQAQIYASIAENDKQIASIDSQLTKAILENAKQLEQIESQLKQLKQTLEYQELRAPTAGTIFDLQAKGKGYVDNGAEPILKIVPDDILTAQVFITNQDIGFVKPDMQVDVRIDAFPYSEFDDIPGRIIQVGSDVLEPDEVYPYHRFPVTIELDQQFLSVNSEQIGLQSGMSISANIKTRKRRVITIFTDLFTRKIDALKSSN